MDSFPCTLQPLNHHWTAPKNTANFIWLSAARKASKILGFSDRKLVSAADVVAHMLQYWVMCPANRLIFPYQHVMRKERIKKKKNQNDTSFVSYSTAPADLPIARGWMRFSLSESNPWDGAVTEVLYVKQHLAKIPTPGTGSTDRGQKSVVP